MCAPSWPCTPDISVEFLNLGGRLSKRDLSLESQANFLAITQLELVSLHVVLFELSSLWAMQVSPTSLSSMGTTGAVHDTEKSCSY